MTSTVVTQLPAGLNSCYLLSDFFGDCVFNLESGIDFNKEVFAVFVHQELHGSRILVSHLQQKETAARWEDSHFLHWVIQVILLAVYTLKEQHSIILMSHETKRKEKSTSSSM